jgi:hypothetical protein
MPTQPRVPGAASSEVDFELERFERTREDRIEIAGRWYGLRGRRFVRPVLNLQLGGGVRRRAIALLEHKPWAADDGQRWVAAFAWPAGAGEVEGAELEVGPGLIVDLPAPGGEPGSQGRVSALRPHAPAPMARRVVSEDDDLPAEPGRTGRSGGDDGGQVKRVGRAGRAGGHGGHQAEYAGSSDRPDDLPTERRGRAGASSDRAEFAFDALRRAPLRAADAPEFTVQEPVRERTPAPPRDVLTAAIDERDEALAARDEAERERVQALNDRDDALSRRDAALRDVERAATERDEAVAERDRLAAELERVTRERDVADAERKRMIQDAEAVERQRDQAAAERDAARSELSRALPERDHALREAEEARTRADRAESERDTAFAERKTAVAQRDRARRERDRAMRAVGVDPPVDTPFIRPQVAPGDVDAPGVGGDVPIAPAAKADAAEPDDVAQAAAREAEHDVAAGARGEGEGGDATDAGAAPPGAPLPSRPIKRIGATPAGPAPEAKPLLTRVDAGRPRRLSRTRRPPSAPARWAVRIVAMLVLIAVVVVLAILLGTVL